MKIEPDINVDADDSDQIIPYQGWHVLHLLYSIEHSQWSLFSDEEQLDAKTDLTALIQHIRTSPNTQLLTFSMMTPKSDLGFMLLTDDLHQANEFEKKLTLSLGPDVLTPVYSYFSMTEADEYAMSEEAAQAQLYPDMPDWPVVCFYPMSKRRGEAHNWYSKGYEARRELMTGYTEIAQQWAGKVHQLISGSSGLDEFEWAVTLFAQNTQDIKEIVYQMRFDEMFVKYGEFGDFHIGLQLPLDELFRRVQL